MTTFTKSDLITELDALPQYRPVAGQGLAGRLMSAEAVVSVGATDATTVVYRMVRLPSYAIIKKVEHALELDGGTATTFTGSIGLYWSDNTVNTDGTPTLKVGSATAISASCFAYQLACASHTPAAGLTDVTFRNVTGNSVTDGYYRPGMTNMPIWLALTSGENVPPAYNSATNQPNNAYTATFSGTGAISSTSNDWYKLTQDPGGMIDVCFNPTTTNSLDAAHNYFMRVLYVIPAA
jgi:hypothetical protein